MVIRLQRSYHNSYGYMIHLAATSILVFSERRLSKVRFLFSSEYYQDIMSIASL